MLTFVCVFVFAVRELWGVFGLRVYRVLVGGNFTFGYRVWLGVVHPVLVYVRAAVGVRIVANGFRRFFFVDLAEHGLFVAVGGWLLFLVRTLVF